MEGTKSTSVVIVLEGSAQGSVNVKDQTTLSQFRLDNNIPNEYQFENAKSSSLIEAEKEATTHFDQALNASGQIVVKKHQVAHII